MTFYDFMTSGRPVTITRTKSTSASISKTEKQNYYKELEHKTTLPTIPLSLFYIGCSK